MSPAAADALDPIPDPTRLEAGAFSVREAGGFAAVSSAFRDYAAQQLRRGPGGHVPILEALDRAWSQPLTLEQGIEKLAREELAASQATALLPKVPSAKPSRSELTSLVGTALAGGGLDALQLFESPPPGSVDIVELDRAMAQSMETTRQVLWIIDDYLAATGREEWSRARPFFGLAFATAPTSSGNPATVLLRLRGEIRPDRAYVEDAIQRYSIPERKASFLKRAYGIR